MSDPFRVRVRVRRPAITRPDSKKFHLVHASAGSAAMAVAGLAGFTERPEAASPPSDPDAELTEALATSVDQLCTLLQGHDAFDVMALLRQFLVPPNLALWSESQSGGGTSWGCAEVVALALLGLGLPTRAADNDRRTAGIVPELVARAAAILQLSEMAGLRTLAATHTSALATVAWRLRSFETRVRGRQDESVAGRINNAIPSPTSGTEIWQTEIGYTLDDVLALRAAITAIIENAGRGVLDHLAMAAQPGDAYLDPVARAAARTPRDPRDADRRDHHPAAARPGDGVGSAEVPGARHDQPAGRPLGDVDNLPGG